MSIVISIDVTDRFVEAIVEKAKAYGQGWIEEAQFDSLSHSVEVDVKPDFVGPDVNPHYTLTRYRIANAIERITLGTTPTTNSVRADVVTAAREDESRYLDTEDADRILQAACFGTRRF